MASINACFHISSKLVPHSRAINKNAEVFQDSTDYPHRNHFLQVFQCFLWQNVDIFMCEPVFLRFISRLHNATSFLMTKAVYTS